MVNPLSQPFVRGQMTVASPTDAARQQLHDDVDQGLKGHMEAMIGTCPVYRSWKRAMPGRTPAAIAKYQKQHGRHSDVAVDAEIASANFVLPLGQVLYHGGHFFGSAAANGSSVALAKPLSASLLPCVARMVTIHSAKAYKAGVLELMVMTIRSASVRAFVMNGRGNLGHEHEVLLGSGATLILRSVTPVQTGFRATAVDQPAKLIPTRYLEVDVV
ncbi:hypothetical protein [Stenotrophomonas sp. PS02297]|uniref:hypothetical protein n=1 Tax=Stenotrophomonas sp. PS02297 TaxID=2991423 RepID=UPI00249AE01B|nr:hypothetical protein [Stenotrophomonas sp. PS02297]